jgi:hypothetical protein
MAFHYFLQASAEGPKPVTSSESVQSSSNVLRRSLQLYGAAFTDVDLDTQCGWR